MGWGRQDWLDKGACISNMRDIGGDPSAPLHLYKTTPAEWKFHLLLAGREGSI